MNVCYFSSAFRLDRRFVSSRNNGLIFKRNSKGANDNQWLLNRVPPILLHGREVQLPVHFLYIETVCILLLLLKRGLYLKVCIVLDFFGEINFIENVVGCTKFFTRFRSTSKKKKKTPQGSRTVQHST